MSSTTLVIAVTGGVFCGASLIGAAMILFLWLQVSDKKTSQATFAQMTPTQQFPQPRPTASLPMPHTSVHTMPPTPIPQDIAMQAAPAAPQAQAGQRQIWLDGVGGMVAGQRMMIDRPQLLIGRSGVCDLQFHDPKISRQHAMLRLYDGHYQLEDMRSTGGTFVNGKRITVQRLRDHDQIRIGDSVLVFRQQ